AWGCQIGEFPRRFEKPQTMSKLSISREGGSYSGAVVSRSCGQSGGGSFYPRTHRRFPVETEGNFHDELHQISRRRGGDRRGRGASGRSISAALPAAISANLPAAVRPALPGLRSGLWAGLCPEPGRRDHRFAARQPLQRHRPPGGVAMRERGDGPGASAIRRRLRRQQRLWLQQPRLRRRFELARDLDHRRSAAAERPQGEGADELGLRRPERLSEWLPEPRLWRRAAELPLQRRLSRRGDQHPHRPKQRLSRLLNLVGAARSRGLRRPPVWKIDYCWVSPPLTSLVPLTSAAAASGSVVGRVASYWRHSCSSLR